MKKTVLFFTLFVIGFWWYLSVLFGLESEAQISVSEKEKQKCRIVWVVLNSGFTGFGSRLPCQSAMEYARALNIQHKFSILHLAVAEGGE